ncbi:MAG: putative inorganic carbon transporter subunit DabA [Pseudomonadota bacterium]
MSTITENLVSSAIQQALNYLPVVWPLQQFIATNPLWDLTDQPLEERAKTLQELANIQTTLPLSEYWHYYQQGNITDMAIQQSINEFYLRCFKERCKNSADTCESDLFQDVLHGFMIDNDYQQRLADDIDDKDIANTAKQKILFSYQIRDYGYDSAIDTIQSECLNYLSAYFNPTDFQKKWMADLAQNQKKKYPFYHFWHTLLAHKNVKWQSFLEDYLVGDQIETIIITLLAQLAVPENAVQQYLFEIAWQLKGWLGYIKWQQRYPNNPYVNKHAEPSEIIAMWLAYEVFWRQDKQKLLTTFEPVYEENDRTDDDQTIQDNWLQYVDGISEEKNCDKTRAMKDWVKQTVLSLNEFNWLWHRAYELSYQTPLYQSLSRQKYALSREKENTNSSEQLDYSPKAQWVFCIDVRSEGFRRHLERVGPYETFGFAGFFGMAYQLHDQTQEKKTCQCPALIEPSLLVEMLEAPQSLCKKTATGLSTSIHLSKKSMLAPFALYEIAGLWFTLTLTLKNYGNNLLHWMKQICFASEKNNPSTDDNTPEFELKNADTDTMTMLAKNLLKGIGLTDNFAEFVMICGHTASSDNNPYQAALDCGACGGNSGMSNAVIACQLLNNANVRAALANQNIHIPRNTLFIAACHNTTTDKIHWYTDTKTFSQKQITHLKVIKQDAIKAGSCLQKERLATLPGDANTIRRSSHWAELVPEWGLANNAAFIIGKRQLTQDLNLERRVFLHSYISEKDPDGSLLASIFLGPVVVAHWINSQYYFSSVSPEHYSAGNKALHNVLSNMGVMEGNQSDLKYGLPHQSLFYQDQRVHQPQRLFVLVDAEADKIDTIINKNPSLKALVDGQWIFVKSLSK